MESNNKKSNKESKKMKIKEIKEKIKDKVLHFVFTEEALERMQEVKELPKEEKEKVKSDTLKQYSSIIICTITLMVGIFIR